MYGWGRPVLLYKLKNPLLHQMRHGVLAFHDAPAPSVIKGMGKHTIRAVVMEIGRGNLHTGPPSAQRLALLGLK